MNTYIDSNDILSLETTSKYSPEEIEIIRELTNVGFYTKDPKEKIIQDIKTKNVPKYIVVNKDDNKFYISKDREEYKKKFILFDNAIKKFLIENRVKIQDILKDQHLVRKMMSISDIRDFIFINDKLISLKEEYSKNYGYSYRRLYPFEEFPDLINKENDYFYQIGTFANSKGLNPIFIEPLSYQSGLLIKEAIDKKRYNYKSYYLNPVIICINKFSELFKNFDDYQLNQIEEFGFNSFDTSVKSALKENETTKSDIVVSMPINIFNSSDSTGHSVSMTCGINRKNNGDYNIDRIAWNNSNESQGINEFVYYLLPQLVILAKKGKLSKNLTINIRAILDNIALLNYSQITQQQAEELKKKIRLNYHDLISNHITCYNSKGQVNSGSCLNRAVINAKSAAQTFSMLGIDMKPVLIDTKNGKSSIYGNKFNKIFRKINYRMFQELETQEKSIDDKDVIPSPRSEVDVELAVSRRLHTNFEKRYNSIYNETRKILTHSNPGSFSL